jgi:SAM-dependent methyltransferase
MPGISLHGFTSASHTADLGTYISALEAFDQIEQLQELKRLGIERIGVAPGSRVLDAGCGFGLETLRLARIALPTGEVTGCDLSPDFLAEARHRAEDAHLNVTFEQGHVESLPYPDFAFNAVWSERLLIYVPDLQKAVSEIHRVLAPGGKAAFIEPDLSTTTINFADRSLVRRVMGHEAETSVVHGYLPGELLSALRTTGFTDIALATRVLVFPHDLAVSYFTQCGRSAAKDGAISSSDLEQWTAGVHDLGASGQLFATVGYFLFTSANATPPTSASNLITSAVMRS